MTTVFMLYHLYEYNDESEHEELKILGIYSSEARAKSGIQYYKNLKGFSRYPLSCFNIDSFILDTNADWRGGFSRVEDIDADFDKLAQCFNEWTEGRYVLFEDVYNSPLLIDVCKLLEHKKNNKNFARALQNIWNEYFPQIRYESEDFLYLVDKISSMLSMR